MSDLVERLRDQAKCRRCRCNSCGRAGAGELHDHVCTDGPDCIETRDRLRKEVRRLRWLCGDAARALADKEPTDDR